MPQCRRTREAELRGSAFPGWSLGTSDTIYESLDFELESLLFDDELSLLALESLLEPESRVVVGGC
jgi:hypothetical protein